MTRNLSAKSPGEQLNNSLFVDVLKALISSTPPFCWTHLSFKFLVTPSAPFLSFKIITWILMDLGDFVWVDNIDPSVIYSPGWVPGNDSLAYDGTQTGTLTGGDKATISFIGELFNPPQKPLSSNKRIRNHCVWDRMASIKRLCSAYVLLHNRWRFPSDVHS